MLQAGVKEVTTNEILLSDGQVVPYGLSVWAAGNGPLPLVLDMIKCKWTVGGLSVDDLSVDELSVETSFRSLLDMLRHCHTGPLVRRNVYNDNEMHTRFRFTRVDKNNK